MGQRAVRPLGSVPRLLFSLTFLLTFLLLLFLPLVHAASPLRIAGNLQTIESTPLVLAISNYSAPASLTSGGVANIASVDLALNAETQALRLFATNKDLRIIYTVCEVTYRLVASKKAGIRTLADLKGKKIGAFPSSSAAYFVERLLDVAGGLRSTDYTVVSGSTCNAASSCSSGTFPYMLAHGSVDAIGIWEPSAQLAIDAMGGPDNVVVFANKTVYREIFNLHATAAKLKDAATRRAIIAVVKGLNQAEQDFDKRPDSMYSVVAKATGMDVKTLKNVWPVHGWTGYHGLPADLLDVLEAEDKWVAQLERRTVMARSTLAGLVDDSVFKEAMQA
jgi:ABC-type nitrate/sulfonate/bicarbonate transport system substrate-binding protein